MAGGCYERRTGTKTDRYKGPAGDGRNPEADRLAGGSGNYRADDQCTLQHCGSDLYQQDAGEWKSGTDGSRRVFSNFDLNFRVCAAGRSRRIDTCRNRAGKRKQKEGRTHAREWRCDPAVYRSGSDPCVSADKVSDPYGIRREQIYRHLWDGISVRLFVGTLFVEFTLGLNPFITCQGKSKIAMMTIVIGAGLNIVLDPVLIFGLHMGVKGSAVATVLSQAASAAAIVGYLLSTRSTIRIRKENFWLQTEIVRAILALGVSSFIVSFTECLINVVFNWGLQKYGGDSYVGAMTIIQSVMQLVYVFSNGITQGVQPVISFNYGACAIKRVRLAYRIGFFCHIFVAVASCIVLMRHPTFFAAFFTEDPEILGIIQNVLPLFICGWGIFGIQSGAQCAFVGLGQAKISLFLACLRKVFLLVPLAGHCATPFFRDDGRLSGRANFGHQCGTDGRDLVCG